MQEEKEKRLHYATEQLTFKTILICASIIASVSIWRYYSPYQTFMRDCIYNEHFKWEISKEQCTWQYKELLKENSWLKEFLR